MSLTVLQSVIDRPAMYFGTREGYLRDIVAFDLGVRFESGWDQTAMEHRHSSVPTGFISFVCSRLAEADGGPSWSARIEGHSASERDAWSLFLSLWTEYSLHETRTENT